MDLATLIGSVVAIALVIGSILVGGSLNAFIDYPSIMIVIGGTTCVGMVSESMGAFFNTLKVGLKALFVKIPNPKDTIAIITKLSTLARRDGLIALENEKIDDTFLARAVRLAVDGMQAEDIRAALSDELKAMKSRHKRGIQMFKFLAATGPAMGMIGTLIGLVQMLQTLDDPSAIGPSMAVALLTTLYGAIIAFMICGPLAEKLGHYSDEEGVNMNIVIEGMEAIVKGESARVIQEKLDGFLAPKIRGGEPQAK